MRHHWRLGALLTTILLAPSASVHAQHETHATSAGTTSKSGAGETMVQPSVVQPSVAGDIARLRTATAPFRSLDSAVAAGYERNVTRCISHPQLGGMGFHHQNAALVDGRLDVEHPEILVYHRAPNGAYELVSVEYQVPFSAAPRDSAPPTIMGQQLKPFDAIKMWYLHVWPWLENPAGMFADWNPKVTCG
jgi:hypothetical protein